MTRRGDQSANKFRGAYRRRKKFHWFSKNSSTSFKKFHWFLLPALFWREILLFFSLNHFQKEGKWREWVTKGSKKFRAPSGATKGEKETVYTLNMKFHWFSKKFHWFLKSSTGFSQILEVPLVLGSTGFWNLNATLLWMNPTVSTIILNITR